MEDKCLRLLSKVTDNSYISIVSNWNTANYMSAVSTEIETKRKQHDVWPLMQSRMLTGLWAAYLTQATNRYVTVLLTCLGEQSSLQCGKCVAQLCGLSTTRTIFFFILTFCWGGHGYSSSLLQSWNQWWFQTQASPGIAQITFWSIVVIAYVNQLWMSGSDARITGLGNLTALKPPMISTQHK